MHASVSFQVRRKEPKFEKEITWQISMSEKPTATCDVAGFSA